MFTHSKPLTLALFALLSVTLATAQPTAVTITIAVSPAYTNKIDDYISQPNKIMATLINTTATTKQVYVQGSISEDGGIRIYTDPGYKMPVPLVLQPGIPYFMNLDNIQEVFDADHLVYEGITKNDLIYGNGIPEGDYRICLSAYDYTTNSLMSAPEPQSCSNVFSITDIEPPVIISPVCDNVLNPSTPQLVTFTWTKPPGSPLNTQYSLKIIEVLPSDRNINDAMRSAAHPVFFEQTLSVTTFLFGPAEPALVLGKRYAFAVTAIDPLGQTSFRNNGMSEVCSFDYGKIEPVTVTPTTGKITPGVSILPLFQQQFELTPKTVISGRILAKFPTNPDGAVMMSSNLGNAVAGPAAAGILPNAAGGPGGYSYAGVMGYGVAVQGNVNYNNIGFGNPLFSDPSIPPYLAEWGSPILSKIKSKKFIFENTETTTFTKPLGGVTIKLIVRMAFLMGQFGVDFPDDYGGASPFIEALDQTGKFRGDGLNFVNVVLAVTETDADGNFTFDFHAPFFTGPCVAHDMPAEPIYTQEINPLEEFGKIYPGCTFGEEGGIIINNFLNPAPPSPTGNTGQTQVMSGQISSKSRGGYICLKVEVENQKFCSPDIDIFAMPGDVVTLPVQMAKVKTYDLTVEVKASDKPNQLNESGKGLAGVDVAILRDTTKLNQELPMLLDYEGQRLTTRVFNKNGAFKNVSKNKTKVDGKQVFRNLIRHDAITPQYLISLSTRDFSKVETSYDFTLFNYEDLFTGIEDNSGTQAEMKSYPRMVYNHEYKEPTQVTLTYVMNPLLPEIKGRTMVLSNLENTGMKGIWVRLVNQNQSTKFASYSGFVNSCLGDDHQETAVQTNDAGFFRFTDLPVNDNNPEKAVKGPYRRIFISATGYDYYICPPINELPYNLLYGQLKDIKDVNLTPKKLLKGVVEDEDGNPVAAYVKSDISPFFKTKKVQTIYSLTPGGGKYEEQFEIPVSDYGGKITVNPLSSQYLNRDTICSNPYNKFKVIVYKRLHRPAILVKNGQGDPVPGAKVQLAGLSALTDAQGIARFKFAAAADQFVIRITPPQNYAPLLEPIDIPVSATYTNYTYTLKPAKSITGKITEKGTGTPLPGAKIYTELKQADGFTLYLEATAGTDGTYILGGIPKSLGSLVVHVVKEGKNPSYAGVVETLDFKLYVQIGTKVTYNFELERIDGWDLSEMWGFPMVVEKFTPLDPHPDPEAMISGYFMKPPTIPGFQREEMDLKLPFKDISVRRDAEGKTVPVAPTVTLEKLLIPVKILPGYSGDLTNITKLDPGYNIFTGQPNITYSKLVLSKEGMPGDAAAIAGHVKIDLASFRTAHDFNGQLYIGDDTIKGKAVVFSNKSLPGMGSRQFVFSLGAQVKPIPIQNYRVFNFNADADMADSYREGEVISLRTILHTAIPGCATCPLMDLKIRAGDLVIKGTSIEFKESPQEKLNFNLEKWKVYSQKSWYFDKNEESIVLPEVLIVTGSGVDAKVVNMKIRPKSLSEGQISLTGGLTLGGVAPVKLSGTLKPVFSYDKGVGHYRISLVGETNQPAGSVENLPNTIPATLSFSSIGMLSDGTDVLSIGQKFRFFGIIDMYVDQVMSGPGFFKLNGQPDPGIPGFTGASAVMIYAKSGSKLTGTMEPIKAFVDCTGRVKFFFDQASEGQSITPGLMKVYGNIKIMPDPGEGGEPFYFRGLLTKTGSSCKIDVITVDGQKLYAGNNMQEMVVGANKIMVDQGTIVTSGDQWGYLTYRGHCSKVEGMGGPKKDGTTADNILNFTVYGTIDVSSSSIDVTNIDTPLGSMSLSYNFDEGSLTGSLTINSLQLGFGSIDYGMMNIRFDGKGFYMTTVAQVTIGQAFIFAGGFIIGSTSRILPEHYLPVVNSFEAAYQPNFANGIKGFYLIGERKFVDKDFNLVVVISAKAGIGAYVYADFGSNPEFTVGGYGYAKLVGGIDVELCFFGICSGALVDIHGGYKNGSIYLVQCGTTYVAVSACGVSLSESFKMEVGYENGFNVDIGLGSCGNTMSKQPCGN